MSKKFNALICLFLGGLVACAGSNGQNNSQEDGDLPTLTVLGFSCEAGSKKCGDRRVGREMQVLVSESMEKRGRFRRMEEPEATKKHLRDVADMLWTSAGTDILPELVDHVEADYLIYGRVLRYEQESRLLWVELTLVQRENGRMLVAQGAGKKGNLKRAVDDAVKKLDKGWGGSL